jgi:hypothetical protein
MSKYRYTVWCYCDMHLIKDTVWRRDMHKLDCMDRYVVVYHTMIPTCATHSASYSPALAPDSHMRHALSRPRSCSCSTPVCRNHYLAYLCRNHYLAFHCRMWIHSIRLHQLARLIQAD